MSNPAPAASTAASNEQHLGVLDGWRGISIALVFWGHLFPAGPRAWAMNEAVAAAGMVLFFVLSGFLITSFLLRRPNVPEFLIRRLFRILPLAWLYLAVCMVVAGADPKLWLAHFSFVVNLPPQQLIDTTSHFWSLCVEIHFYLGVALLVAVAGRRGLWLLPLLCLAVTANRIHQEAYLDIVTVRRVDEILAGACLALWYFHHGLRCRWRPPVGLSLLLAVLTLASAHSAMTWLCYFRPYLGAALIGTTLLNDQSGLARVLKGRTLAYLAKISYALYVVHGGLRYSWLASGDTLERYLKRPLFLLVCWALAHLSTHYYEARFLEIGRRLSLRFRKPDGA